MLPVWVVITGQVFKMVLMDTQKQMRIMINIILLGENFWDFKAIPIEFYGAKIQT